MRALLLLPLLVAVLLPAEDLAVAADGLTLTGRLFLPATAAAAPRPAVLVVHEWWGRNAYADRRAAELAERGYAALSVDLYGEAASDDFPTAQRRSAPFYADPGQFVRRLAPFAAALRRKPDVDGQRLAAIGFCFGGSAVLQWARSGAELRGVVAFHPGLATAQPATRAPLARILVCHGGADPFVPPSQVADFIAEMTAAKADWRMDIHGQAVHAFTNPEAGRGVTNVPAGVPFARAVAHHPAAEAASIDAMQRFLDDCLR